MRSEEGAPAGETVLRGPEGTRAEDTGAESIGTEGLGTEPINEAREVRGFAFEGVALITDAGLAELKREAREEAVNADAIVGVLSRGLIEMGRPALDTEAMREARAFVDVGALVLGCTTERGPSEGGGGGGGRM